MNQNAYLPKGERTFKTLLEIDDGEDVPSGYAVYIHHGHLDHLVGRMMQMCDLIGDVNQRDALKDTLKRISRDWLDDMFEESGYQKYEGLVTGVQPVKIQSRKEIAITKK